jgi:hypothetical protein
MKKILLITVVLLTILEPRCYSQEKRKPIRVKPDTVSVDSVEYKLIVLDQGFELWLAAKPPMNFYSKEYYVLKNRFYVLEWNYRYHNPLRYGNLYETPVEYEPNIDYGIELNYRLYYYFRFFEEVNHVKLIDYGP